MLKIVVENDSGWLNLNPQFGSLCALSVTVEYHLLTMFQGIVNAVDMPARQTFLADMVADRADLPNAIALNSSMVNSARLIGPSITGILIAVAGEGACFLIDGFSYLAVIGSLLMMMRITPGPRRAHKNVWSELKDGFGTFTASFQCDRF